MVHDSPWQLFLRELDAWIAETGSAYVPQAITRPTANDSSYALGKRLHHYIGRYHKGLLTSQQITDLESRPGWTWTPKSARSRSVWQHNLDAVQAFVNEHGTLDQIDQLNPTAARWLRRARTAKLTVAQRKQLERIPGASVDRRSALADFIDAVRLWTSTGRSAGSIPAAATQALNGTTVRIGRRARYFRERYANGLLDDTTVAALESLPGWSWGPRDLGASGQDEST